MLFFTADTQFSTLFTPTSAIKASWQIILSNSVGARLFQWLKVPPGLSKATSESFQGAAMLRPLPQRRILVFISAGMVLFSFKLVRLHSSVCRPHGHYPGWQSIGQTQFSALCGKRRMLGLALWCSCADVAAFCWCLTTSLQDKPWNEIGNK